MQAPAKNTSADATTKLPGFVQIEPVGQCNLRCRMCPIQFRPDGTAGGPPAFMSFDAFCSLIDQFSTMTELQLQGMGEPLLHPRIFDMVRYAADRGIVVSTNTNMTALSERRARECTQSGLSRMHVSLDGASAGTYEFIRARAKFDRVLRNLRRLTDAKLMLGSSLPRIELVAVVMRVNLHELPDLVRLARHLDIDVVSVQHLCHDFAETTLPARYLPMRSFVDRETLLNEDPSRVAHYFDAARAAALESGVSLRLPDIAPEAAAPVAQNPRCDWPWRGAYVSYAGDAMPCCMVATPDRINFGNMARDGVAQIWNNAAYSDFRSRLASGQPPEICSTCAVYKGTF